MNVLLIAPEFYGYDIKIKEEIENQGNNVDLYCEYKIKYSFFEKIVAKFIDKNFYKKNNYKKQKAILEKSNKKNYDMVLVIVGRFLTEDIVKKLKDQQKNARFVLYLWDDVNRCDSFNCINKYFEKIYSFDRMDCSKYGFTFLPLFYTRDFKPCLGQKTISVYGAFAFHSDRLKIINQISDQADNAYFYIFLYPFEYIKFLFLGMIKGLNRQIHLRVIPLNGIRNIKNMQNAKCILDIQYPTQNGLTIRTIESVGCENKLLTTNSDIINYDFYNPKNIAIIDRDNPKIPEGFLDGDYEKLDTSVYTKYSIENFIKALILI